MRQDDPIAPAFRVLAGDDRKDPIICAFELGDTDPNWDLFVALAREHGKDLLTWAEFTDVEIAAAEYVELSERRNRGWPWPEDSFGLSPMFGEDGWCRSCGVPNRPQCGSLILQRKSIKPEGAWVPYWEDDAICLSASLAEEVEARFQVDLRPVVWHASSPGDAFQIVVPTVGESWFDPAELKDRAIAEHGTDGARCAECGVWRWMPLVADSLPPYRVAPSLGDFDIAASPEWFGDGMKAFRQMLVRSELAQLIVKASPRDFEVTVPRIAAVE